VYCFVHLQSLYAYRIRIRIRYWPIKDPQGAEQGRIQEFKLGGGGALKKIAPSGERRENFWGISCEKSRFYAKKSYPLHSNYNDWQYGIHAYNVHVHNNNKEILIHMYYSTLEVGWGKEMTKPLRKSRSNITRLQSVASGSFQTYLYPKCW
jgi:hypothetical protein